MPVDQIDDIPPRAWVRQTSARSSIENCLRVSDRRRFRAAQSGACVLSMMPVPRHHVESLSGYRLNSLRFGISFTFGAESPILYVY